MNEISALNILLQQFSLFTYFTYYIQENTHDVQSRCLWFWIHRQCKVLESEFLRRYEWLGILFDQCL